MAKSEGRQINIWASPELVAGLEALCPEGLALSAFARGLLERVAQNPSKLPPLQPSGQVIATVDLSPVLDAIAEAGEHLEELQKEILRAVHDHGGWHRIKAPIDEDRRMKARDYAAQMVREWERSVGRSE